MRNQQAVENYLIAAAAECEWALADTRPRTPEDPRAHELKATLACVPDKPIFGGLAFGSVAVPQAKLRREDPPPLPRHGFTRLGGTIAQPHPIQMRRVLLEVAALGSDLVDNWSKPALEL